jgi:hypothetical protein
VENRAVAGVVANSETPIISIETDGDMSYVVVGFSQRMVRWHLKQIKQFPNNEIKHLNILFPPNHIHCRSRFRGQPT